MHTYTFIASYQGAINSGANRETLRRFSQAAADSDGLVWLCNKAGVSASIRLADAVEVSSNWITDGAFSAPSAWLSIEVQSEADVPEEIASTFEKTFFAFGPPEAHYAISNSPIFTEHQNGNILFSMIHQVDPATFGDVSNRLTVRVPVDVYSGSVNWSKK